MTGPTAPMSSVGSPNTVPISVFELLSRQVSFPE